MVVQADVLHAVAKLIRVGLRQTVSAVAGVWGHVLAAEGILLQTGEQVFKGVLADGAARVAPIANATVRLVKERMGLYT